MAIYITPSILMRNGAIGGMWGLGARSGPLKVTHIWLSDARTVLGASECQWGARRGREGALVCGLPRPLRRRRKICILKGRSVDASGFGVGAQRPPGADGCGHAQFWKIVATGNLNTGTRYRVCETFFLLESKAQNSEARVLCACSPLLSFHP